MKLKQYSFIILLVIISFSLMSNQGGRGFLFGVGLTNSPGESGATCGQAGCHSGGNFGTGMDIYLSDPAGNILNEYEPGMSYNLHLNITNSIGNPQRYGFQMVALDDTSNPINNWGDITVPYRKYALGDRDYIEQTNALLDSNIVLSWTAPAEGSGNVNFYATVNNCNGNGNSLGDQAFSDVVVIAEGALSSSSDLQEDFFSFYPNPVSDRIQIRSTKSNLNYSIYDRSGVKMKNLPTVADQINVDQLLPGMYFILANDPDGQVVHSERFIKI
jgi:hypothetical protein